MMNDVFHKYLCFLDADAQLSDNFFNQSLQGVLLSCTYTMLDYAQTGLIAAVFFFKVSGACLCTMMSKLTNVL